MQNTPAPWTAAAYPDQYRIDGHNGQIVLIIRDGLIPMREDARLIAAAPDLLAALVELLPHAARVIQGTTEGQPLLEAARAAIARVEA
jgi:hypothetical protein